jgi:hypothetical protein
MNKYTRRLESERHTQRGEGLDMHAVESTYTERVEVNLTTESMQTELY